jgi:hypothetical protein
MKNVHIIGLSLSLLAAPALQASWLPSLPSITVPTIGMPESKYGKAAVAAAAIAGAYAVYKSGIVGKTVACVVDKVVRHPKKTIAFVVAAAALAIAHRYGYLQNPFAQSADIKKQTSTPVTDNIVQDNAPVTSTVEKSTNNKLIEVDPKDTIASEADLQNDPKLNGVPTTNVATPETFVDNNPGK